MFSDNIKKFLSLFLLTFFLQLSVGCNNSLDETAVVSPVITIIGDNPMHLTVGDTFTDPGATAVDDRDGDLTVSIQTISNVVTSIAGNYAVIYTVTDSDGNTASATRSVVVDTPAADITAPVITLIGDNPLYLNIGENFSDPGATAQDDTDGDLTASIQIISNVDTSVVGSYTVSYSVTDVAGNTASATRSVVVDTPAADITAPVITLIGDNPFYLNIGENFSDPGATAQDDIDGDLTASIQTTSNVDTSVVGSYTVSYSVTDVAGNTASATRSVVVSDQMPPPNTVNVPDDYPTLREALLHAVEGSTILLAPGIYNENELDVDKNSITIASRYLTTGDESYIDNTVIQGDPTTYFIAGLQGQSKNLRFIGLTIRESLKAITFNDDNGEVHYCKIYDTGKDNHPGEADSIGFDKYAGGGSVTHCLIDNSRDDGIDIDAEYHSGVFVIAYNIITNSHDDGMEIRLFPQDNVSYLYDIHDNLWSGCQEDGIQLIDYDDNNASGRTFDIYRNIFVSNADVGLGTTAHANTIEDFSGSAMAERINLHNNYFYSNNYHVTGGDNMIILNNIFEVALTKAVYRAKTNSITDYNLFFNNAMDENDTLIGAHNIYGTDPLRNSDFTLQQVSPAIDAGVQSYTHNAEVVLQIPTSEYTGLNPDMGRYEYGLTNTAVFTTPGYSK